MAFLNKLKELKDKAVEVTANTTQKVKDNYEQMKVEQAEKRAIAEAYDKEMKEKVNILAEELKKSIEEEYNENSQSFFSSLSEERLISFTKEFYEKILLPANSVSKSSITMYPYIEEKKIKNIVRNIPQIGSDETIIIHFKDSFNQEFVLTTKNFYFKVSHNDDKKYYAIESIPYSKINKFEVIKEEDLYYFKCNNFNLASLKDINIYEQDYIILNDYFRCIEENDFEITDEEIDKIIQEKIGHKIYQQIKKYMIYDDEYAIYFAWGLDTITAKDYVVCTTKQIIIMDREILGATSNVKQFYYEDITSMTTLQNGNGLLDMAFSAMFKQCDLEINVAGAREKINTLNKIEAQRVIAIYHEYRKMLKNNNQPKIIVQQEEKKEDVFEQLEKLAKLKEMGILTEEEFNTKKMNLLQKI
ncbi:SHOCT domain-containing protein [Paraclostridium bifermentans]|uniref:SHOCT domain-containing protein n=1 Tax=Paraclostridium bifermentans TaxID=1490 RepID=UPI001A9BE720|nr:SHOCT domain-containing protein [Paraclostridium bifermentans]